MDTYHWHRSPYRTHNWARAPLLREDDPPLSPGAKPGAWFPALRIHLSNGRTQAGYTMRSPERRRPDAVYMASLCPRLLRFIYMFSASARAFFSV